MSLRHLQHGPEIGSQLAVKVSLGQCEDCRAKRTQYGEASKKDYVHLLHITLYLLVKKEEVMSSNIVRAKKERFGDY